MKKKAVLSVLMAGAFLLLCLIPSVGMLLWGPSPLLANETARLCRHPLCPAAGHGLGALVSV